MEEKHDKNETLILSKHTENTSLSVPKIAFGAGNNQRRPSNTSQNSTSQQGRSQRTRDKNDVIVEEYTKEEAGVEVEDITPNFISDNIIADGIFFPSMDKVLMNQS